jgi:hypothetical protein
MGHFGCDLVVVQFTSNKILKKLLLVNFFIIWLVDYFICIHMFGKLSDNYQERKTVILID